MTVESGKFKSIVLVSWESEALKTTLIAAAIGKPSRANFLSDESSENGDENIFEYTVKRSFCNIKQQDMLFERINHQ